MAYKTAQSVFSGFKVIGRENGAWADSELLSSERKTCKKTFNSLTVVDLVINGRDALGLFPKKLHEEP